MTARLPNSIKCKEEESARLNAILKGCDYALFGNNFRLDRVKQRQRYTKALNEKFDEAYGIMKEFDYADADMLEVLYNYRAEDLASGKQEERIVKDEFKQDQKETARMLAQMNSKLMRAKRLKKRTF